jgi:hypothetical protein
VHDRLDALEVTLLERPERDAPGRAPKPSTTFALVDERAIASTS